MKLNLTLWPGLLILSLVLGAGCSKTEDDPTPATPGNTLEVKTDSITGFQNSALQVPASVNSKDNFTVTSRGICYGTTSFPVLKSNSFVEEGSGFGNFTVNLTGLNYRNKLYIRAFAISRSSTNKTDTSYGNQLVFFGLHTLKTTRFTPRGTDTISFSSDGLKASKYAGLSAVTGKGICWGTGLNPVPGSGNFFRGTDPDTLGFTGFATGLQPGTVYYFRTFAVNAADTVFSENLVASTSVRDIESNLYTTQKIGNQLWLRDNLNTGAFSNGDPLLSNPQNAVWDTTKTPACSPSRGGGVYGKYYNQYSITDGRNLCPTGWHVPARKDWDTLFTNLGGWNQAGRKLKANTTAWGNILTNQGTSNFNAIPAGFKDATGEEKLTTSFGYWWTRPEGPDAPSGIRINNLDDEVFFTTATKNQGFSVRCVKD